MAARYVLMDLETLKLLLPVIGTLAGAFLGGMSAYLVARANVGGQRAIAREADQRTWRKSQVQPLLDVANRRMAIYRDVTPGLSRSSEKFQAARQRAMGDESPYSNISYEAVSDQRMQVAAQQFIFRDMAYQMALEDQLDVETMDITYARNNLMQAIAQLNQAAEAYVYGFPQAKRSLKFWHR